MSRFSQPITIDANGKDIEFNGVDFTTLAMVTVTNAKSITIRNCRIYGLTGSGTNKYWLNVKGDIPVKLTIERNFFGKNTGIYNLLELTCKLEDGSSISNNYFKDATCTHNYAGIYGAADNATINLNTNYFETSKEGGIRLGMKGDATCVFNVNNNKIAARSNLKNEEWEGLLCLQPFGKATTSMANCIIYMNHNSIPSNQVVYAYSGSRDTMMTEDLIPTVVLDRLVHKYPILH